MLLKHDKRSICSYRSHCLQVAVTVVPVDGDIDTYKPIMRIFFPLCIMNSLEINYQLPLVEHLQPVKCEFGKTQIPKSYKSCLN